MAEANQQSEQIRGEGDATRNQIFAEAYGQDPGFFAFYRSMQAYERSMQKGDTHLVLRPDSDFFRYFGDPSGKTLPDGTPIVPRPPQRRHAGGALRRPPRNRTAWRDTRADEIAPMSDFLAALGLFFAIEGMFLAAFPGGAKRTMATVLNMPDGPLRIAGIVSAAVGVLIVWLVRG